MAIPYESGESTFFLNDKNEYICSIFEPRGPKNDQKYSVLPSKKKGTIKNSYEMINSGRECAQIYLFYHAKRPSPSPLSHGIAFCEAAGSKMDIPCESGGGIFPSLHFARGCRPKLEGCAPTGAF